MKLFKRSIKNVLRKPLRLILVVTLLGTSLMFVAAMVSLSASSQQELAAVRKQVDTTIVIKDAAHQGAPSQKSNSSQKGSGPGSNATPVPGPGPGSQEVVPDSPHISNSMVTKVKNIQGVVHTEVSLAWPYTEAALKSISITLPPLSIDGISRDSTNFTVSGGAVPTLVSGRGFQGSDANASVAMMSQALARTNHLRVGSTFTLNGMTFTLIGLYTTSSQTTDNTIIIPLATLQKMFHLDGVTSMVVTAASPEQVEAVAARLRSLLGPQFDVTALVDHYNNVFNALQVAQKSIQATLVASLLIAAAIIVFAVLMLVRERTAEIATLKTIGASHMQVLRQFWIEILTLSSMAAALAILLIVSLGSFLSHLFDINASSLMEPLTNGPSIDHPLIMNANGVTTGTTSPTASNIVNTAHLISATLNIQTLLIILGVGMGLALLTSLIPTWFVAHLKPALVLRKAS
jgi:ABC-type antimicrobial peptide transport system permease subunit